MSETTTTEREPLTIETEASREATRAARQMVPVGPAGVQISNLAEQVDYAQSMAKASIAMPRHLRGNVGDCLAIIDISQRAGLSPYMVANHTYVMNDKLCFESQLYHAFLQASGLLVGDLEVEYEGTDGDKVCVITGYLKTDPDRPKVCRSLPLRERHPGYVLRKAYGDGSTGKQYLTYAAGEKLRAEGGIEDGMKLFSQGSPLWTTKVDVAQFYDTTRDWTRMWAPRATMGVYTVDEMQDFAEDMKDVTPPAKTGSGLSGRLRDGEVNREEGHGNGDVAQQMKDAKTGAGDQQEPDAEKQDSGVHPETPLKDVGFKPATLKLLEREGLQSLAHLLMLTEAQVAAIKGLGDAALKGIKEVIGKHGFVLQVGEQGPAEAEAQKQQPTAAASGAKIEKPRNAKEWEAYCRAWIAETPDHEEIRARWDNERQLRNACGVTAEERGPVMAVMVERCKALGEPQK